MGREHKNTWGGEMKKFLLRRLRQLLPSGITSVPASLQSRRDDIARRIVARHAEGSVRLSLGLYRTAAQVDADFETLRNAKF